MGFLLSLHQTFLYKLSWHYRQGGMTREEAIAAGMEVHEIQHSMKRRTSWHDYSRKGTYMLTLVVRERMALLGTLSGSLEGEVAPCVEHSALGSAMAQEEQKTSDRSPSVWLTLLMQSLQD